MADDAMRNYPSGLLLSAKDISTLIECLIEAEKALKYADEYWPSDVTVRKALALIRSRINFDEVLDER